MQKTRERKSPEQHQQGMDQKSVQTEPESVLGQIIIGQQIQHRRQVTGPRTYHEKPLVLLRKRARLQGRGPSGKPRLRSASKRSHSARQGPFCRSRATLAQPRTPAAVRLAACRPTAGSERQTVPGSWPGHALDFLGCDTAALNPFTRRGRQRGIRRHRGPVFLPQPDPRRLRDPIPLRHRDSARDPVRMQTAHPRPSHCAQKRRTRRWLRINSTAETAAQASRHISRRRSRIPRKKTDVQRGQHPMARQCGRTTIRADSSSPTSPTASTYGSCHNE